MSKYENAMKLMEERCGNGKEEVIALATISLSSNAAGTPRPAVRMVCAYYEDGVFYVSTDAKKNKILQIEKNNEVSVGGLGWYAFQGTAENLGWVKDEKNAEIRAKFKKSSIGSLNFLQSVATFISCVATMLRKQVFILFGDDDHKNLRYTRRL